MSKLTAKFGCGCITFVLIFNLLVGGWSINYISNNMFNKNLPLWGDVLTGVFVAEISVPVACVAWTLKTCGINIDLTK